MEDKNNFLLSFLQYVIYLCQYNIAQFSSYLYIYQSHHPLSIYQDGVVLFAVDVSLFKWKHLYLGDIVQEIHRA